MPVRPVVPLQLGGEAADRDAAFPNTSRETDAHGHAIPCLPHVEPAAHLLDIFYFTGGDDAEAATSYPQLADVLPKLTSHQLQAWLAFTLQVPDAPQPLATEAAGLLAPLYTSPALRCELACWLL